MGYGLLPIAARAACRSPTQGEHGLHLCATAAHAWRRALARAPHVIGACEGGMMSPPAPIVMFCTRPSGAVFRSVTPCDGHSTVNCEEEEEAEQRTVRR